jgi:RNA polymerase sigma-70 factor, ECF subfamily
MLRAWTRGEDGVGDRLIPLVYEALRRQAAGYVRRERRREHTLRPTELVHEVFLRLAAQRRTDWKSRAHFFGIAAQVMRRVLVDHARRRGAAKRAGSWCRIELAEGTSLAPPPDVEILALERALDELEALDPLKVRLIELRFYGGLNLEDAAAALGVSASTVSREWRVARAWLYQRLGQPDVGSAAGS